MSFPRALTPSSRSVNEQDHFLPQLPPGSRVPRTLHSSHGGGATPQGRSPPRSAQKCPEVPNCPLGTPASPAKCRPGPKGLPACRQQVCEMPSAQRRSPRLPSQTPRDIAWGGLGVCRGAGQLRGPQTCTPSENPRHAQPSRGESRAGLGAHSSPPSTVASHAGLLGACRHPHPPARTPVPPRAVSPFPATASGPCRPEPLPRARRGLAPARPDPSLPRDESRPSSGWTLQTQTCSRGPRCAPLPPCAVPEAATFSRVSRRTRSRPPSVCLSPSCRCPCGHLSPHLGGPSPSQVTSAELTIHSQTGGCFRFLKVVGRDAVGPSPRRVPKLQCL